MRYVVDLHSHSGYAGGVGRISLETVAAAMSVKGIDAFGVGDCLQPAWRETLAKKLVEREAGLFALREAGGGAAAARFVLQTEVIVTSAVASGGRKGTHVVLTFPGFAAVDDAIRLLARWGAKIDMGRPFVKCADAADVAEKCFALRGIDLSVMVVPAHVLTPQGVYGSDHPVDRLPEVFGQFAPAITAVETGLSSDPALLAVIPELDDKTLISSSDCHSGALNRVGREFTALDIDAPSYAAVVAAIRGRRVLYTAEFNPAEGRYFLTGHRAGLERHGRAYCYFSPDRTPAGGVCPICGKPLTIGVLERALHLSRVQSPGGEGRDPARARARQEGRRLVPLVEVLAAGLGVKSVAGRKIAGFFKAILDRFGTEAGLWDGSPEAIRAELAGRVPDGIVDAVVMVRKGDFSFQPGYDGEYGVLVLGRDIGWFGQERVCRG